MKHNHLSRRSFLRSAGILSAACFTDKDFMLPHKNKKTGLQMYTMRHIINSNNAANIIERIALIGYRELEIFGYNASDKFWGYQPGEFKKLLKANGLKAPSAHIAFEDFLTKNDLEGFKRICEAAAMVGNKYVVLAWLDEQYRSTAEDYIKIAAKLNDAALIARQFDLQMAYHNHDFEFKSFNETQTGYAILLQNTDNKLLKMELDLYWCAKAGVDVIKLIKENAGRFALWHVKDMDSLTKDFTEVGSGVINFKEIFSYADLAGLKHYFIEQDKINGDAWQSIEQSYRYIKNNVL